MEYQNQELQRTLEAAEKARQTFLTAHNSPFPEEMQQAEQEVANAQRQTWTMQTVLGKASADDRFKLQEAQEQLHDTLRVIKNTQHALKRTEMVQTINPTLH
ncbi:hypothetical protein [Dehalobacterium formicoaceticum]|uniref:Uncharacterized protein n=1 Tax=Dehalobacterium formicoaceticum TaxID=51515 RepID=A0ABT1Y4G1_9FIRM|nr:hypothetical protein [Dehalobacterium formicoaceticum]MCR6545763.1 hypothetical protein [Dehalobacterium formicoaceticum]